MAEILSQILPKIRANLASRDLCYETDMGMKFYHFLYCISKF